MMLNSKRQVTGLVIAVSVLALLVQFALHAQWGLLPHRLGYFRRRVVAPTNQLEIRLDGKSIINEGLGAVVQGLKPVLLLANATGAVITAHDKISGHGYHLNKYIRLDPFIRGNRIKCAASKNISKLLNRIVTECNDFPYHELPHLFTGCNMIVITKYLVHPRTCLERTAPLVRAITRFKRAKTNRDSVCLLRRGGDVEDRILSGKNNVWALDNARMIPVLDKVRKRGARIVVITETRLEALVRKRFRPHILSNKEPIQIVVRRLDTCRCLFVSSGSSFAVTMVQVSSPTHVIYTESHSEFKFSVTPYPYDEFGERAHSVLEDATKLADLCVSPLS